MFFMDYFGILGLNNIDKYPKITAGIVEERYREIVTYIDKKIKEIMFDYMKDSEEKKKIKDRLLSENELVRRAYNYCKKEGAILLRNKILQTLEGTSSRSLSSIREKQFNKENIAVNVTVTENKMGIPIRDDASVQYIISNTIDEDMRVIETDDIEFISKMPDNNIERKYMSEDGYIDKTLKRYIALISENDQEGHSYSFYAGKLDFKKMREDPNYKKIFLQELERIQMDPSTQQYLGFIYQESDGKYTIAKDEAQKNAVEKAEKIIKQKESMREEDWQK